MEVNITPYLVALSEIPGEKKKDFFYYKYEWHSYNTIG